MGDYLSCEVKFNEDKTRAWLGQPHMIKKIEKVFGEKVARLREYKTRAWLGQPHMIKKIEKAFGEKVSRLREYKTPGTPGFGIVRPKDDSEKVSSEMQSEYMSGVGMLLYLVTSQMRSGSSPSAWMEQHQQPTKKCSDWSSLCYALRPGDSR